MVEGAFNLDLFDDLPGERLHGGCASCGIGQALADSTKCGNGLEKIYPTTAVRFGYLRFVGEFTHASDMKFTCGARVIIQTRRGIEMGEQVSLSCSGCSKSVTREQMKEWVASCGEDAFLFDAGRILREATAEDLAEYAHIQAGCKSKRVVCQEIADRYKLPLTVVECEHLFGGERLLFYFTAEERVDFRSMVRDLTKEYRTRIEMRQVGARDEARLLADYETCGREVCCKVYLKTLRPITMRMAKLQKATLDPTQVSGRCGRLKCCLRYEHIGYEELDKMLPRNGLRIRTNHGEGVIVNRQVLTQLVQIRKDDGSLVTVVAEDITEVGVPAPPRTTVPTDAGPIQRPGLSPRSKPPSTERIMLRDQVAAGKESDADLDAPVNEREDVDQSDRRRPQVPRPPRKRPDTPPTQTRPEGSSPSTGGDAPQKAPPGRQDSNHQRGRKRVRRRRGRRPHPPRPEGPGSGPMGPSQGGP